jgi:hypothetical protein
MSIRGTADDNIATAIWGNPSYGVQSGQEGLVSSITAQLAAQGIDPASASQAQVMAIFSQQAAAAQAAAVSQYGPPAPAIVVPGPAIPAPAPQPAPAASLPPAITPAALAEIPTWVWWTAGIGAALLFFRR